MKIYNNAGIEILDIQVDDSSVRYRSIMSDDSLTLQFSTTGPMTVPLGAYVDFEGARYTLFYKGNFKKNSPRDFAYTLTLHGWREALKFCKCKDIYSKPYRLKFPLTARPIEFLQLVVDCMNIYDGGWSAGDCIEADEKLISFNHEWCFNALNRVAEEFSTEWEVVDKVIHLRKVERFKDDPLPLSYGMGNGFKPGVGRSNNGDKQPIGRLYVEGGERNIDFSEYGSSSLLLPKSSTLVYDGKTYRTDAEGMYITRDGNTNTAEDSYDGSSHYPKRVGTVSHVIVVDSDKHFYDIRDTSIPEALNFRDCRIAGEKATIVFQSGALAGREFDIEQSENDLTGYIHAERRFKIVPAEMDGTIMPGGVFVPMPGDKYAIFNISMPAAYISDNSTKTGASWDMFRESVKYFAEEESDKFSFTGELDGIWSKSRWPEIGGKIVPGGHVLFSDLQFQPDGVLIRITAIKDYINKPHKPEITLSNAPVSKHLVSSIGKLEAEEVVRESNKQEIIRYTKRQYRDTKDAINDISDKVDGIKVGENNLLRNSGFLGDFLPLEVDALTAVLENTQVGTNPLVHWVHNNTEVIDAPSRSGKGVKIGSIQQTVYLRGGESYMFSLRAKGGTLTFNLVESVEIELTDEYEKYVFEITAPESSTYTFGLFDSTNSAQVYEPMLAEGNTETGYSYAPEDDLKAISHIQAINTITSALKDFDTDILGGLILTSMIQLGKYKDGVMEKVNAGINGIFNNDDDPAFWAGGSFEEAIRTVQRIKSNPYSISEEDWEELANIVLTHGGDGIFRGIIYALGGIFRGRIESSVAGNRIIINPSDQSLKMYNQNDQLALSMQFDEHPMGFNDARINVFTYNDDGEVMHNTQITPTNVSVMDTSIIDGTAIVNRANMSPGQMGMMGYTTDGQDFDVKYQFHLNRNTITEGMNLEISTVGLPTTGNGLATGMWYVDDGTLKVKQ